MFGFYFTFVLQYEHRIMAADQSKIVKADEHLQMDNTDIVYHRVYEAGMTMDTKWDNTSHKVLTRGLTMDEHKQLVDLLETFNRLMEKNNISYIMCDGTLLGSYFFHDFIPWDDDLDLMMDLADRHKLNKLFVDREFRKKFDVVSYHDKIDWYSLKTLEGRNPSLTNPADIRRLEQQSFFKFKFFQKSSKKIRNYPWRWPFIDIKFYNETKDLVQNVDGKKIYKIPTKEFFPLHLRPFAHLWLPAPHNTRYFLQTKFKKFKCRSHSWDHKNETFQRQREARCQDIYSVYPHVQRTKIIEAGETFVMENLMLGSRLLHSTIVDEPWQKTPGGYYDL